MLVPEGKLAELSHNIINEQIETPLCHLFCFFLPFTAWGATQTGVNTVTLADVRRTSRNITKKNLIGKSLVYVRIGLIMTFLSF